MKRVMYSIVITTAIVLTSCGGETKTEEHNHEGHEHSEMSSAKYACPMKCEGDKAYADKGKCSVCEMDLEEVK